MTDTGRRPKILALSGGVGGAKLALGLCHAMAPEDLAILVNTGDDFRHLGLWVSPDIDTLLYTLSGLSNPDTGWGRAEESGHCMAALKALGGEDWFFLGDKDLATHLQRSQRLAAGDRLSAITADFAQALGIQAQIWPMSDDPVPTIVSTADGDLAFQHYFVREQCRPCVTGFRFQGAEQAKPYPPICTALADPMLQAVIICPSNPFISIDPILALPGLRAALQSTAAPVIAVSPIVGGKAIKGPTAKMLTELGLQVSAVAVAEHYRDFLNAYVLDTADRDHEAAIHALGLKCLVTNTVMNSLEDRRQLATDILAFRDRIDGR